MKVFLMFALFQFSVFSQQRLESVLAYEHERIMFECRDFCMGGRWDMGERKSCLKDCIEQSTKAYERIVVASGDYRILCEQLRDDARIFSRD